MGATCRPLRDADIRDRQRRRPIHRHPQRPDEARVRGQRHRTPGADRGPLRQAARVHLGRHVGDGDGTVGPDDHAHLPGRLLITSVVDPAGRTWTFGYTGSDLVSITEPDPDGAGALAAPVTTIGYASHAATERHPRPAHRRGRRATRSSGPSATPAARRRASSTRSRTRRTARRGEHVHLQLQAARSSPSSRRTARPFATAPRTRSMRWAGRPTITDPLSHQTTQTLEPRHRRSSGSTADRTAPDRDRRTPTTPTARQLVTETDRRRSGRRSPRATTYNASNDVSSPPTTADGTRRDGHHDPGVRHRGYRRHARATWSRSPRTRRSPDTSRRHRVRYWSSDLLPSSAGRESASTGTVTTHAYDATATRPRPSPTARAAGRRRPTSRPGRRARPTGTHDRGDQRHHHRARSRWPRRRASSACPRHDQRRSPARRPRTTYDALGRTTSETPPDGTTTHEWDQLGNEIRTTDPGSLVTTRTLRPRQPGHDETAPACATTITDLRRRRQRHPSQTVAGDTVSRTYDGNGLLAHRDDRPGHRPHLALTTEHAYDASGRETAAPRSRPAPSPGPGTTPRAG